MKEHALIFFFIYMTALGTASQAWAEEKQTAAVVFSIIQNSLVIIPAAQVK